MHKLVFILSALLIIACENEDNTNPVEPREIVPLAVGNTWTYVDSAYLRDTTYVDTSILEITNSGFFDTPDGEDKLFYYSWDSWYNYDSYAWLVSNTEDGFCFYGGISNGTFIFDKSLSLKYPVEVGDSWFEVRFPALPDPDSTVFVIGDTIEMSCTGINKTFATPIKQFRCYEYHYKQKPAWEGDIPNDFYYYYVPGVGRVGRITINQGNMVSKRSLVSYTLN